MATRFDLAVQESKVWLAAYANDPVLPETAARIVHEQIEKCAGMPAGALRHWVRGDSLWCSLMQAHVARLELARRGLSLQE